jgi:hypothetical protein
MVLAAAFAAYVAVAFYLVYVGHLVLGDAVSRVGNAYHVFYSRDPHLAAIGFVWSPIPSLAVMPLLPLKAIWPDLVRLGFAGNITTAGFMAGAVYLVYAILAEIKVNRLPRFALTIAFALHPMIVYYAANGMSEAGLLFFLLLATRYFVRWAETRSPTEEVFVGFALAGAYLTRYEALPAAAAVVLVVMIVSYRRAWGEWRTRLVTGISDGLIVGAPVFLAVALWAGTSWIITGNAFEYASSVYGNSSQLNQAVAAYGSSSIEQGLAGGIAASVGRALTRILSLEPLAIVVVAGAAIAAFLRRKRAAVAVLTVFVPVLGFTVGGYLVGAIFPWLRVYITVIPLTVLLAGTIVARDKVSPARTVGKRFSSLIPRGRSSVVGLLVVVLVGVALPVGASAMRDSSIARVESAEVGSVLDKYPSSFEARIRKRYVTEREVAAYLDNLGLPRGSVLLDVFNGFPIEQASRNPAQFVIDSDRDFKQFLADPAGGNVRYMLVPEVAGLGALDAINRSYPGLYANGSSFTRLVQEFANVGDGPVWRLYLVTGDGGNQ